APIELVRDLFDAETAWAKEAWCVNSEAVRTLAEELLTRGGPAFVEDFLAGKLGRGMDAHCASYFDCPRELAERLLAEVERRLVAVGVVEQEPAPHDHQPGARRHRPLARPPALRPPTRRAGVRARTAPRPRPHSVRRPHPRQHPRPGTRVRRLLHDAARQRPR